jgi:hypothetical protein
MRNRLETISTLILMIAIVTSCRWSGQPAPPGWRSPVSELLVEESDFPRQWMVLHPEDSLADSTVNHVVRRWGRPGISGVVTQAIWRAYSVSEAESKYGELCDSQFQPSRSLPPNTFFVKFEPPSELDFQSQAADEFYLACGWWDMAYCEIVARYHNYVVDMLLEREAELNGHRTHGLTYPEIEAVIKAMDAKFEQFFVSLSTPTP